MSGVAIPMRNLLIIALVLLVGCAEQKDHATTATSTESAATPPRPAPRDGQYEYELAAKAMDMMRQRELDQNPLPARSVLSFGAIGNGTTDNTEAFQKAVDSVHKAGGGTVL